VWPTPLRYYALWSTPLGLGLTIGVWCCPWGIIKAHLPSQRLIGSGVQLKGFDDLESAIEHYHTRDKALRGGVALARCDIAVLDLQFCENAFRSHRDLAARVAARNQ
jgi:hypothetical protein